MQKTEIPFNLTVSTGHWGNSQCPDGFRPMFKQVANAKYYRVDEPLGNTITVSGELIRSMRSSPRGFAKLLTRSLPFKFRRKRYEPWTDRYFYHVKAA